MRHKVYGISSSFDILYEKYVLLKSRFTRNEIGIILDKSNTYLKKYNGHNKLTYLNTFIINANINIITNNILEIWLIY